jgi:acylphosphatase
MPHKQQDTSSTLTFHLTGQLHSKDFHAWMTRQAQKLEIDFNVINRTPHQMDVSAFGTPVMLEAFALACSLGPKSVCIDTLEMDEVSTD